MRETKEIILASASPRRKELLELSPHGLARALSLKKTRSVAGKYNNAIIIAADTFVIMRGQLLGKPHTEEEARRMLLLLDGATHSVITGFTILDTDTGKKISRSVETKVTFKNFNVIGLPLCPLVECLTEFGIRIME